MQENSELKVSVFWGDVLYDTALCKANQAVTVGRDKKNTFILDLESQASSTSFKLIEVHPDQSADVYFDESLRGHLRFGKELVSLAAAPKSNRVVQEGGLYRARIGREDRADIVIDHVSFFIDWAEPSKPMPKGAPIEKNKLGYWLGALFFFISLVVGLEFLPVPEPEKPPERLVSLTPPKSMAAKAAIGQHVSEDGGAQTGELGKAELKTEEKKAPTAAEKLRNANLGSIVGNLTNLKSAPTVNSDSNEGATAAIAQKGTGGFSTEGLKAGGGGKSVGIGRQVGKGEGGYEGTGRLGLSGDSALEGGTGHGVGQAQDTGGLDRDVIDAIIRRRQDRIRLCYERQLNFNAKLAGKISLRFVIGKEGTITSSKIIEDTMKNANVNSCVLAEVKSWTFPKPKGGYAVSVDYPFVFESSAK